MAKFLESFNVIASFANRVDFIEEVRSEVLIGLVVFQHMVDDDQEGMAHGHDGASFSPAFGDLGELGAEVRVFGTAGGPGALSQDAAQPAIGLAGFAAFAFAGAFFGARTDARLGGQMFGRWKLSHIGAHFGQQRAGTGLCDPGAVDQQFERLLKTQRRRW